MFADYLERTTTSVVALRSQLATNEYLRSVAQGREQLCAAPQCCSAQGRLGSGFPEILQWRILDHCTTFTRLYAIYEQFVYALIETMLSFYEKNYKYADLPNCLTAAYKTGFAKIVEKVGGPRYSDISLVNLLESFQNALAGVEYKIEPRAILMHDQNLRLDELCSLLAKCEIGGIKNWLSSSPPLIHFFSAERSNPTVDASLKSLVQFRNDAAHGGIDVDDILNSALLIEYADFVQALCASLAELVRKEILLKKIQLREVRVMGTAEETFRQGRIAIISFEGFIQKGQSIYILDRSSCRESKILSIQINGVQQDFFGTLFPVEVGLEIQGGIRRKSKVLSCDS